MQNKYDYYEVGCGTNFTQFYHSIRFIYRNAHYCNTKTSTSRNKYLSNLCKSFCKGGELLVIHSLVDWKTKCKGSTFSI
jgi:hypothetical protein